MSIQTKTVNTIRVLAADAVQAAKSGHPGLPMGAAPAAYALWGREMNYNPANPAWCNRDRFVLSAGHGSALLYSLFHVFGVGGLSMDELKRFRQMGSLTPGHPEYGHTMGVETTTGPLGQGICNAVGFAMAEKYLADHFNREGFPVVDHYTYVLMGDGCMMEGISGEACSMAGALGLGKLIALYDSNNISIEGDTSITFTEDVGLRYQAYGWHVQTVQDGNDVDAICAAVEEAKKDERPSLIIVKTQIGYGCPAKQGKASAHGEPLGDENLRATKEFFGFDPDKSFVVDQDVYDHAAEMRARGADSEKQWNALFAEYAKKYPELKAEWDQWFSAEMPDLTKDEEFWAYTGKAATRNSSGDMLNRLAKKLPNLIGGSADLAPSNKSNIKGVGEFTPAGIGGPNLHFGVREHAMAAICNGMALHGGLRVYCATFFVFSDYMKHAMRLSALMQLPVLYILTHDSIGVGEDGPTHQPIEQLAMLRSIPGMAVFRPADAHEVAAAYAEALRRQGPTTLVLTRQDLPLYENSDERALKGAYVLSESRKETPDMLLMASGSEVELMMQAQQMLWDKGVDARVVSMPCWEVFEQQSAEYKESVLPKAVRARLAAEAASPFGWHRYIGLDGDVVCMEGFGASAPAKQLFEKFGFTAENVVERALALVK